MFVSKTKNSTKKTDMNYQKIQSISSFKEKDMSTSLPALITLQIQHSSLCMRSKETVLRYPTFVKYQKYTKIQPQNKLNLMFINTRMEHIPFLSYMVQDKASNTI